MTSIEDPHTVLHLYEGDGGVIIRENGNVSTFGAQSDAVTAAFYAASDDTDEATTRDLLATIAGLRQKLERVTQERDDAERGRENAIEGSVERLKRAEEAEAQLATAKAQLTRATDPEYLAEKLHQIGAVDAEWKARAERAEAENARLRSALEPFARLAGAVFRVDEDGRMMNATKADEASIWGFDREEITYGDLRAAHQATGGKDAE